MSNLLLVTCITLYDADDNYVKMVLAYNQAEVANITSSWRRQCAGNYVVCNHDSVRG